MEALIREDESAPSGIPQRWGDINWRRRAECSQCRFELRRRHRKDWRRVKALQRC
jgi:RNA-directed DNA polymerase